MRRLMALAAALSLLAACGGSGGTAGGDTTTPGPSPTESDTSTSPTSSPDTEAESSSTTEAPAAGTLTVYSGRNENFVEPVIEAFTEATGIEVEVRYAGTGDLATTIVTEGDSSPADVFWAQDPAFIGGLAKEGFLTELPEDITSMVQERFVDANGHWVGITGRARVFVHNTDLVAESELPADVWALTEPEWEGRLGVAPTNGSFVAFVTGMILSEGEERTAEWLEGIAANNPQIFDGNGPIVDAVVAGDLDAGLVNHYYLLQRIAELGEVPAENHFFADGDPGGLVMAAGAGVLQSSDQPEVAEDFIRHLLSQESQEHFLTLFEYPLVEGVGTPEGQLPLEELPTLDISLTDTADTLDPALTLIAESGLS
ncbi:MAG TPA: iron ABC transporter substrate-binding protein [Acidimicrobiia bacterium]|nr:iron ABC transporter substrate-binding protein [Acidimicrobiia bacterium]